jgi:hypothetical protein
MLDKLKRGTGPLLANAKVQTICWGTEWSAAAQQQDATDLTTQLTQLMAGPYMRGLSQYGISPATVLTPPVFDVASTPPPQISEAVIGQYLQNVIGSNGILDYRNDDQLIYLVVTLNRPWYLANVAGFHSWTPVSSKSIHWAWIMQPSSGFASHEIIEACTDPEATGWLQPENGIEVGDICEDSGNIAMADGVDAAIYWSNVDGACILPHRVAKIKAGSDPATECVGPHLGGKTRFTVTLGVEPAWIDPTGIPIVNPQYVWSFNPAFASPVGSVNGPSLELQWNATGGPQTVGVTVTADVGMVLAASVTIKNVLNPQETLVVRRMCDLRKMLATTALLPPPAPDPEGPIIASILPTPSEVNRLRAMIGQMGRTLDHIAELNGQRPISSGRINTSSRFQERS